MRHRSSIDMLVIDCDEDGWHLRIETEDGDARAIRAWWDEGAAARYERELRAAGQTTIEDVIDSGAADLARDIARRK